MKEGGGGKSSVSTLNPNFLKCDVTCETKDFVDLSVYLRSTLKLLSRGDVEGFQTNSLFIMQLKNLKSKNIHPSIVSSGIGEIVKFTSQKETIFESRLSVFNNLAQRVSKRVLSSYQIL